MFLGEGELNWFSTLVLKVDFLEVVHVNIHCLSVHTASALQWKAFHSNKETQDATLRHAEREARNALDLVIMHYGEVSLRTAQVYSLLGQVYSKMDRWVFIE